MSGGKAALVVALAALVFAFFFFDLGSYLNLSYLKAQQSHIRPTRRHTPCRARRSTSRAT